MKLLSTWALWGLGSVGVLAAGCDSEVQDGDEEGGSTSSHQTTSTGVGGGPPITGPTKIDCTHKGSGVDYAVGPGQAYERLGDVPFETLKGGDTVRIFYRAEPYREKVMIGGKGTPDQPVRVCGVPGPSGELPVIDGNGATSRAEDQYPYDGHQVRGVVTIGHRHDDPYEETPGPFVFEGVAVTGGIDSSSFTDVAGATQNYSEAAAGIFVQRGRGVTIRGCVVTGNGNGIFAGTSGAEEGTYDVLLESNHVYGNGRPGSDRQHNVYNESIGIIYQFNVFGPPNPDSQAGNVKDRSSGTIVRYNVFEGGGHQLDLVDAQEAKDTTVPLAEFHQTFAYGNTFTRPLGQFGSMIHYGGDSYVFEDYRKGTLYFFANTVVVHTEDQKDYDTLAMFELSTNDEHLWTRDNVFYTTSPTTPVRPVVVLGPRDGETHGIVEMDGDWLGAGITETRMIPGDPRPFDGSVAGFSPQAADAQPGFVDVAAGDYHPVLGSMLIGAGVPLVELLPADYLPVFTTDGVARDDAGAPTQGALLQTK